MRIPLPSPHLQLHGEVQQGSSEAEEHTTGEQCRWQGRPPSAATEGSRELLWEALRPRSLHSLDLAWAAREEPL